MSVYDFLYKHFRKFMSRFLYPTIVEKRYDVLPEGPIVLCANHLSAVDVILLICCTEERKIRFMAKKELFSVPFIGWLIKAMGSFPVERGAMDVPAIKKGVGLLKSGETVGIFPQGTRCAGVHPAQCEVKVHAGVGMMAERTHATILPVSIETKNFKIRPFRRVRLCYGKPIPYEEYVGLCEGREGHLAVSQMAFERVCSMIGDGKVEKPQKSEKNKKTAK